ncbi:hypothetical protein HSX37_04235|uniref:Uncharacterized protein n=1 Tax=Dendrosporobacter quercicolus TaxID=146817 RepID=A0A1G9N9G8_9FIRM|nr:hypothetical protein [Dendrosporobacter quercicolus]NSL47263.1 hypothetical protein [Dendrosporobacter quercicolus DSM 1736]SDL82777.1 hypothetical protein SAMN04488502_101929 [Dendrosporobacter quercicolus]
MEAGNLKQDVLTFVKTNWKYILGLVLVLVLLFWGKQEYQQWKQHIIEQANQASASQVQTVTLPPQVIYTNTETIREVAVQAPSQPGAVLSFVEREGKVIAVVNGQEVEVPNVTGQPALKLGENGELRLTSTTTARIDVTELANAQAQLIANQELEKQAVVYKKELDKEKSARKKERVIWIVGTAVGGYLLTR